MAVALGLYFGAYQNGSGIYMWLPHISDAKTTYNAIGATFLVFGLCKSSVLFAPLSTPLAKYLGRISYMLYLVHFPLLASVGCLLIVKLGTGPVAMAVSFVGYVTVTFVVSTLLTRFIDTPAVKIGHRFAAWVEGARAADITVEPSAGRSAL
jgi:peptidoglycan/LPS O-acetylase OafA/YrhL